MEKFEGFIIAGSTPEKPESEPLGTYLDMAEADEILIQNMVGVIVRHIPLIAAGGRVSFILARGRDEGPLTTASFVVDNPPDAEFADRHSWDFSILGCSIEPKPPK